MNEDQNENNLSFLTLERYLANDLAEEEKLNFEKSLESDSNLQKRLSDFQNTKSPLEFSHIMEKIESQKQTEKVSQPILESIPRESIFDKISLWLGGWNRSLAYTAVILLVALGFYFKDKIFDNGEAPQVYASKGEEGVFVKYRGMRLEPGSDLKVAPGDTLLFISRNSNMIYYQVWYKDDEGELFAYLEQSGESLSQEINSSWVDLPSKVILNSNWKKEDVYIVYSSNPFKSNKAKESILNSASKTGLMLNRYTLHNTENSP